MKKNQRSLSVGFLYDDTLDSSDGVAQYVKTLGSWLRFKGHRVIYLVGQTNSSEWAGGKIYSLAKNKKVTFSGNRLSTPLLSNRREIIKVLAIEKPDILHVQVPYSPLMAQRAINLASPQTAVVGTFHIMPAGWLGSLGTRSLRTVYGKSLKRFYEIFSVSPPAAAFANKSLGKGAKIIPIPVDTTRFRVKRTQPASQADRIVFLGRLVKRKGCRQLIEAFAKLTQELPGVSLTIGGDGPERKSLERLVKSKGLRTRVKFLGYVNEKDKPALLASANIACFPSLYAESFGIVLLEAMASGAGVVIGGNNPGYSSILGAKPACLINPLDSDDFSKRLKLLITDKKLRSDLHAWQQKEIEKYDINRIGETWLKVYQEAIVKTQAARHNIAHERTRK